MLIFVQSIGYLMIGAGVLLMLQPKLLKSKLAFFKKGKRLYLAGAARIILGILFLYAAPLCRLERVIVAIGILILVAGILIFLIDLHKTKRLLQWFISAKPAQQCLWGAVSIGFGALIIYAV